MVCNLKMEYGSLIEVLIFIGSKIHSLGKLIIVRHNLDIFSMTLSLVSLGVDVF